MTKARACGLLFFLIVGFMIWQGASLKAYAQDAPETPPAPGDWVLVLEAQE